MENINKSIKNMICMVLFGTMIFSAVPAQGISFSFFSGVVAWVKNMQWQEVVTPKNTAIVASIAAVAGLGYWLYKKTRNSMGVKREVPQSLWENEKKSFDKVYDLITAHDFALARALIPQGTFGMTMQKDDGTTILLHAVKTVCALEGDIKIAFDLIDTILYQNPDLKHTDIDGNNVFHYAVKNINVFKCFYGHVNIQSRYNNKADNLVDYMFVKNNEGMTPFELSIREVNLFLTNSQVPKEYFQKSTIHIVFLMDLILILETPFLKFLPLKIEAFITLLTRLRDGSHLSNGCPEPGAALKLHIVLIKLFIQV